jgi:hypothetical protein
MKFDRMQQELQNAVKDKLRISNDITLLKARERDLRKPWSTTG